MRNFVLTGFCLSLTAGMVRADALENVGTALHFAGFDARGSRNPLSGGADLLVTRQFNGNLFDFGNAELALQGPVSLQLSTGGRVVPGFDVSLSTAVNARSQTSALSYSYSSDIGLQSTSLTGSMLIDADFSINALGFYDLTITSSNRGTVVREGRVNDSTTLDSDIGPIEVSGNVFVDLLGVLVDPLFEHAGRENPLAVVSKLIDLDFGDHALLWNSSEDPDGVFAVLDSGEAASASHEGGWTAAPAMIVPEPTALALLLLGIPAIALRLRRLRHG
jgi:hypothetical protein